jgi:Patatin-like phospholipase
MSETIADLVKQRRAALYGKQRPPGGEGLWGLALSGGGIRSATFSLGLIKALARGGVLLRFDLMSTVSGGGYLGAAVGKLFHQAESPEEVVETANALASVDKRWLAWWLRANGRYLIPRGLQDAVYAVSLYLRNLVAVHIEMGVLGLLLGAVLALANIFVWPLLRGGLPEDALARSTAYGVLAWLPTIWLLLLPQIFAATVLASSYWLLRARPRGAWPGATQWLLPLLWLGLAALLWRLRPQGAASDWPAQLWWAWLLCFCGALAWVLAGPYAAWTQHRLSTAAARAGEPASLRVTMERARHSLTAQLALIGQLGLAVALLGLIDRLAWHLVFEGSSQGWYGATLVGLAGVLRLLLPRLVPSSSTMTPALGLSLALIGHLGGLLLLFLLAIWWVSLAYALVFVPEPSGMIGARAPLWTAGLAAVCLAYMGMSAWNIEFLNRSSLHMFYRARLVRSYLGAANGKRFARASGLSASAARRCPLAVIPDEPDGGLRVEAIDTVDPDDDLAMRGYAPHRHGGPVHLLNICINQTRDPRGGLFNQDRRGLPLSVGPLGLARVGLRPWRRIGPLRAMSLGSWISISGAAFAPGLGGMTRMGIAVLAMSSGLRLGHWWDSRGLKDAPSQRGQRRSPPLGKSSMVLAELCGQFDPDRQRHWYLSDGGHYENTGAYALLVEEAELIVVADCGADPRYGFGDLENLVRKARIDLQTDIKFLRPAATAGPNASVEPVPDCFGSLSDLASATSVACIALASISYRRSGAKGLMVVVKPNICPGLPVDLINFKRENPGFPQQSTTDQFFDEAQWESYFTLGDQLGRHLGDSMLERLPHLATRLFVPDDGMAVGRSGSVPLTKDATQESKETKPGMLSRLPSRIAGPAVATTVGLSAATTLGVSLWQALEGWRDDSLEIARADRAAYKEISEQYGKLDASNDKVGDKEVAALAASVLRVAETLCPSGEAGWFQRSPLAQCVLQHTEQLCTPRRERLPVCALFLDLPTRRCLDLGRLRRDNEAQPRYWGLDLSPPAPSCTPLSVAAVAPAVPAASAAASAKHCAGKTLYTQIYGPERLPEVRSFVLQLRELGATVPATEDVLASALRRGRVPPRPYEQVTILYHSPAELACAEQLRQPGWQLARLPQGLKPTPGVIELWWPPKAAAP